MTIILTAATTWEARPLARALTLKDSPGGFEGRVADAGLRLVLTGIGPVRAARALAAIETGPGLVAISSGLAGALQPGIRSGDLVADLRGAPLDLVTAAREEAKALGLPLHLGAFLASDRVVTEPAEKKALGERHRAVAVDMESGAVRSWCQSRGGQFVALRAVLDDMDQALPDFPAVDESAAVLALQVLSRPTLAPSLLALGWRTRRAMAGLARFLARFLLRIPGACRVEAR